LVAVAAFAMGMPESAM